MVEPGCVNYGRGMEIVSRLLALSRVVSFR